MNELMFSQKKKVYYLVLKVKLIVQTFKKIWGLLFVRSKPGNKKAEKMC